MHSYSHIPELSTRSSTSNLIRLPPGCDIPLTPRVRRILDTSAFRKLAHVSQLGLVRLVYPGAGHSRFEHSLGVYGTALDFLQRLTRDERFARSVTPGEVEKFLLAALLHDIGHWPYCHAVEDLCLDSVTHHEQIARQHITTGELADAIAEDWGYDPESVADLIAGTALKRDEATPGERIVCSMLSGPIDVDKIDYLARDSMHCGVPYGRNFDQARLISSLCLDEAGERIAVTDKGKTAAELMVFARYVMFSEVYWHHAVRAGTAMLQRAVWSQYTANSQIHKTPLKSGKSSAAKKPATNRTTTNRPVTSWDALYATTDASFDRQLRALSSVADETEHELAELLFGPQRLLYKRLAQYSVVETPAIYEHLARQPYERLVDSSVNLASEIAARINQSVSPHEVLIDAPPKKLEVQFDIDVYLAKQKVYRPLGQVSPVVRTLAEEQFDDYVKRVRVFVHPRLVEPCQSLDIEQLIESCVL